MEVYEIVGLGGSVLLCCVVLFLIYKLEQLRKGGMSKDDFEAIAEELATLKTTVPSTPKQHLKAIEDLETLATKLGVKGDSEADKALKRYKTNVLTYLKQLP